MKKNSARYIKRRKCIEQKFNALSPMHDSRKQYVSPSGHFVLEVMRYGGCVDGSWDYSRGIVKNASSNQTIAEIKRNCPSFWHSWVTQGTEEYLLCGEDYQAYNVVHLNQPATSLTFPPEAWEGLGFCWAAVHPSPDGKTLAVEGCYWACPYELVLMDFSAPMHSPLPELQRFANVAEVIGWVNDSTFQFTVENEDENLPDRCVTWHRG